MKIPAIVCAAVLLCLGLVGCPNGANIQVDYNHHVNFSQFRTFTFADVKSDDPFFRQRIEDAVSRNLEAHGLRPVPANGDLEITAVGAVHNRQMYQTFYNNPGFGYYWWGFPYPGYATTTRVVNYKVGTLVLDMYDGRNRHLVWRGTVANGVSNHPEQNIGRLNRAVDKMLSDFPPS